MIRILYAHVDHPAYKTNKLLYAVTSSLRQYGLVRKVVASEPDSFLRVDLLVVETTIPDTLSAFMAGRAFELKIPMVQLYDLLRNSVPPNMIPRATHLGYRSRGDLHRLLDGFFREFDPPKMPRCHSVTRPSSDATAR